MDYQLPGLGAAELTALMDGLPVPVLAFLPDGYLAWLNREAARRFGLDRELLVGVRAVDLPLRGPRRAGGLIDGAEYQVVLDGPCRRRITVKADMRAIGTTEQGVVLVTLVPVPPESAKVVTLEGGAHEGQATWLAAPNRVDPSSGLLARASIVKALESEVSRSRRYSNPFSVLAVEHIAPSPADPDALTVLGQLLQEETRWADSIGRWDASRLLMVLPETTAAAACALVSKLENRLDAAPGMHRARFGLAEWRRGDDSSLLAGRAIGALHRTSTADGTGARVFCNAG